MNVQGRNPARRPLQPRGNAKAVPGRPAEEVTRIVERLWERGAPGDDRAVERMLAANPSAPLPAWLRGPAGTRLLCAFGQEEVRAAAALVAGEYWNVGVEAERLERAMRGSTVLVGARDPQGRLVASARALSDGVRCAWVGDVCVAAPWRGKGVGQAVVRLLLEHPRLRGVDRIRLNTRDAQSLYARFGFVATLAEPGGPRSTEMLRRRG